MTRWHGVLAVLIATACADRSPPSVDPVPAAPPLPQIPDGEVIPAPDRVPVDPGTLPQTEDRPAADDPAFVARMQALLDAVDADDPALAHSAFFPKAAYVALKELPRPARADRDYDDRLLAAFDRDLRAMHAMGPAGRFLRVEIPDRAVTWIVPGREYNRIGYWRALGARLVREVDGAEVSTRITSMISAAPSAERRNSPAPSGERRNSWRGQWYVVHLAAME